MLFEAWSANAFTVNVTRVVGDSGAVFTTETIRNSELKNAIFIIFALEFTVWKIAIWSMILGGLSSCLQKT